MNNYTVSVVIPVFNAEETIERTLDSVREQTAFQNILEILIIDDGSTDNSKSKIRAYQNKYPFLPICYYYQHNQGVSKARNYGLKQAKGEWIALLDADDCWHNNKLERQIQVLKENPKIVFLGTAHTRKAFKRFGKRITDLYKARVEDVLWSYFPVTPSVIFRKEAISTVGYFDESMSHCEDINYYLRFMFHFNYYYLPECLVDIDAGKEFHKEKGLTSNLAMMHKGEMKNLKDIYDIGYLSKAKYVVYYIFTELKYVRRIMLVFIMKMLKSLKKKRRVKNGKNKDSAIL